MSLLSKVRHRLIRFAGYAGHPPGSFYSPIPSMEELRRDKARNFDRSLREIGGVDVREKDQLALLDELSKFYAEQPFGAEPSVNMRYFFENKYYSYSDALFLYSIIRYFKAKRIIEIGSGFSSFVMLDTNDRFFDSSIRMTFIEPYPERLRSRLREKDSEVAEIVVKRVQDVELSRFEELAAGDILFVDSSHVAKVGSDVNHILFEILPRLAPGVLVHIHDIFYPFEYPENWIVTQKWFWNEAYVLRSFLQFNSAFKILAWNNYLGLFHAEKLTQCMPLTMKNIGGSIWLQRN